MVSAGAELLLALCAHDLDDAALDDVRAVAFNKAVYHAGASDQPNLADGEWKKWAFGTAVQLAAAHHLREAVRLAKLLLQFLLVEPLALEGVDLQRLCRKRIASLLNLLKRRYRGGAARKLLQPERILQFRISVLSDAEYSNLFELLTVAPDTDPQSLIDDVFEYDGYTYTYSSMTKEEQSYSEKEHHTETVTADTEKSDLSVVLKALSPSIEYDDGEFRGTLYLDHSTISTVASGYTTKSYTVSATKEIDNLDTNDMAYVPDTTTKNGVTVQLQSVDWQVQGTSLVDDILMPAQYKAVATYAGRASYRAATGYVTTAKYIGDIVAEGIESVTYTVIYTGTPSSILQRVAAKSTENFPIILIFLVVIVLAITTVVLIWRHHKRSQENTVYHEEFSEEEDEHEE